jgi:hypothetical protein
MFCEEAAVTFMNVVVAVLLYLFNPQSGVRKIPQLLSEKMGSMTKRLTKERLTTEHIMTKRIMTERIMTKGTTTKCLKSIGGHRHRPFMSAISNIAISYSDIGTKYVGLNPFIRISEELQYRHQLPFRYQTKSISDIPISKIDKSLPNDPSKIL